MDFVTGVNRLLRINQIIGGDDDDITDFTDTQHAADIELAQIAIQSELNGLTAFELIPYELASGTVTCVDGTRAYALASDFVRFFGSKPSFYDSTDNRRIYEYVGGENVLRDQDYKYDSTTSTPWSWYWANATTKQVAFYPIPDANYDARSLTYQYEKSVAVTAYDDTLPFHNNEEAQAFIECAARRFVFMDGEGQGNSVEEDPIYKSAYAKMLAFITPTNPSKNYGRAYL